MGSEYSHCIFKNTLPNIYIEVVKYYQISHGFWRYCLSPQSMKSSEKRLHTKNNRPYAQMNITWKITNLIVPKFGVSDFLNVFQLLN